MCSRLFLATLIFLTSTSLSANLLRNPGFEEIPGVAGGQGLMPSEWLSFNVTPDTYSNDGMYGINPGDFGNFPGVTAFSGARWVAGWSAANEQFAQVLTMPLQPGQTYSLSGWMLQALRSDLDNPGGYEIYLVADELSSTDSGELLGYLGSTADLDDWAFFTLDFVAPANSNTLPILVFSSTALDPATGSYAGLDNVSLTAIPVPAALVNFLTLLATLGFLRRHAT